MENLTRYIPQNDEWMKDVSASMGGDKLIEYYNRVFLRLYGMEKGECLYILHEVTPDNYQLFIRVVCTVINELIGYGIYEFSLENNATIVCRE